MKQMLRTIMSPMTHLRNQMSSLMFEMKRTTEEVDTKTSETGSDKQQDNSKRS
jgi:hypothetical protein